MSIHDGAFFGLIVSDASTVASTCTVASVRQHKFLHERNCMEVPHHHVVVFPLSFLLMRCLFWCCVCYDCDDK